MVCGGGGARRRCGRGRWSRNRRCASGCCDGGSCCWSDGVGGNGGGGVEANTRHLIWSLGSCCGPSLRLQSARVEAASGSCDVVGVRQDSCLVGAGVVASAVKMDSSLLAEFVGRALPLPVVGVVSQDTSGGANNHEIVGATEVEVEAAQSTMEVACSHRMVRRMAVGIVAASVVATGMGWVVGFLEALGQLACLDSILVLPYLAAFLRHSCVVVLRSLRQQK